MISINGNVFCNIFSCDTCDMDPLNESRGSAYSDVVESLNDPLNVSSTSSTIIGTTIKHRYL